MTLAIADAMKTAKNDSHAANLHDLRGFAPMAKGPTCGGRRPQQPPRPADRRLSEDKFQGHDGKNAPSIVACAINVLKRKAPE